MPRPSSTSLLIASALGALLLLLPLRASAGVRVWENEADNPDLHQYFDIGGFVQPGFYWQQDDPTTNANSQNHYTEFYLQRARINVQLQLTKYFVTRFELEMVGQPALQDAYVESDIFNWLHIRVGQFLVPYLQTFQFNEMNISFLDREIYIPQSNIHPFLAYLFPRDVGISLSGLVGNTSLTSRLPVFEYALGVFNGKGPNTTTAPIDGALEYTGRLQLHLLGLPDGRQWESDLARNKNPHVALGFGASSSCDMNQDDTWHRGVTTDLEFRYEGIYVSGSFIYIYNGPAAKNNPLNYYASCGISQVPTNITSGGHVQAQYLLPKAWFKAAGGSLELLARWDQVTPAAAPSGGPLGSTSTSAKGFQPPTTYDGATGTYPARWRTTVGVNWYPIRLQSLRLSVNYQYTYQTEPIITNNESVLLSPSLVWLQLTAGI